MMLRLNKALRRFRREDDGATLVEYGIAITLAVTVGTFMLGTLGTAITGEMGEATCIMDDAATDDAGTAIC